MPASCRCGLSSFGYSACYSHLKDRRLEGQLLTDREEVFAGFAGLPPQRDGWRSPDLPALGIEEEEGDWMTDQERRLLAILSDAPSSAAG